MFNMGHGVGGGGDELRGAGSNNDVMGNNSSAGEEICFGGTGVARWDGPREGHRFILHPQPATVSPELGRR